MNPKLAFASGTAIHPPPVVEGEIGSTAATNDKPASSPEKVTAKLVSVDEIVSSKCS